MRPITLIAALCVLCAPALSQETPQRVERGALVLENVPETPPDVAERLGQYVAARSASFADWTADGAMLIATRFADTSQIHRVAAPLGARTQLTFYAEPINGADARIGGPGFYFSRDAGWDEQYQHFWFDPAAGRAVRLTEPGTRNEEFVQSRDGARVAWSLAPAVSGDYDIYLADAAAPETRRKILDGTGAIAPIAFSPDGRALLLGQYVSIAKSRLFLLDLDTQALSEVAPGIDVSFADAAFAGADALIVSTDEGSDFLHLVRIDLASGARTAIGPAHAWDVEEIEIAPDGRTLAYVVNEAGVSSLYLYDLRRNRALRAPALPAGLVYGLRFDASGRRLGFTLNSAAAPADAYSYDLRARALTRWTESEVGGLDAATFVSPELISWRSFDERAITGFLYRPRGAGPFPLIIDIHGGPESQYRPAFNSRIQYWVNELGLAVIAPNVRGSAGYGKAFLALDNAALREDSVKDIGALLDWVGANGTFDAQRVLVYGGSYGGYMVLASMTHYNDRLAGAVDIVGISNFVTFLENTSGYRRDLRRAEYGDERDPEMRATLARISPLNSIARVTKPLFVVHGANDPRVPLGEAEQVLAAVRANGGEAWLMLARNEGHGFRRLENQRAQREAETLFFRKVLALP
jgi:dipeptidyl aminopeptidase/acylaminoacyl peptidase